MNRVHSIGLAAAASCVTALLVGGITWAAIPDGDGVINACYGRITGIVRVIDTAKRERCTALENPLSWNQEGEQGAPGTPGTNGTNGNDGEDGQDGQDGVSPTVAQLGIGDPNCPTGGAAITDAAGTTAYVCNGATGADGQDGEPFSGTFTSPNGQYSISVTDTGITLDGPGVTGVTISGSDIRVDADQDVSIRGGSQVLVDSGVKTDIRSSSIMMVTGGGSASVMTAGQLSFVGSTVQVGPGGCTPAARVSSLVVVDPDSGVGSVVNGSPTVFIC